MWSFSVAISPTNASMAPLASLSSRLTSSARAYPSDAVLLIFQTLMQNGGNVVLIAPLDQFHQGFHSDAVRFDP